MNLSEIRFGIIGCGTISGWHANAINSLDGAELAGVYDYNGSAAESFAGKYGTKVFDTLEQLILSDDIDAVCICTPSGLHARQAVMAAKAGKHVIVEKPMALNPEEADKVIEAVEAGGVKLAVISQLRFSPAVKKLKEAVDSGLLGKIVMGDIYMKFHRSQEYYDKGGWRGKWAMDGGGALMNQGIHGVDLLQYIMGPVESVFAYAGTLVRKIEVEDTAVAAVKFRNGAMGVIQATTSLYPGYPRRLEINGDKGSIVLEEDSIIHWDIEGMPLPEDISLQGTLSRAANDPAAFGNEGHITQIKDMLEALRNDRKPMVDAYEGKKPIDIINAVYQSAKSGKEIKLAGK